MVPAEAACQLAVDAEVLEAVGVRLEPGTFGLREMGADFDAAAVSPSSWTRKKI